jgi:hypothetical protein
MGPVLKVRIKQRQVRIKFAEVAGCLPIRGVVVSSERVWTFAALGDDSALR